MGCLFFIGFHLPGVVETLGTYGPFYLYAAICLAGFFFIKYKVYETKGQTLEQLSQSAGAH